jgi:hypothetical protein
MGRRIEAEVNIRVPARALGDSTGQHENDEGTNSQAHPKMERLKAR